ncbi:hypothetical protein [Lentilactobacillus parabuchneri]|uniref:hypothetical protein n=1 Tax=Lentilactobacillus parabuchneri TaxID=152331 RepID=UPI000A118640|nr:hypothetical protein [Lentilactobacillus parabuchneri]ORN04451.1 hypothetical protein FAM21829_01259 [Lentilactobacillus parabuchneri]
MLNEQKLQAIVATFAKYQVEIKTDGMRIVAINGQRAFFDATTFMQDQLIEMICRVLANQLIHEVWVSERDSNGDAN